MNPSRGHHGRYLMIWNTCLWPVKLVVRLIAACTILKTGAYHCSDSPLFRRPIIPTTHYSDNSLFRQPITPTAHFPTMQNRTQSTNPWFNQVYPTGWSVSQANLDGPWPRQNVLERKRSFNPRLCIPAQGNYDRPTWYGESLKLKKKLCTLHKGTRKEEWRKKSVNREKHEKDKMTEDSNTHGSEEI